MGRGSALSKISRLDQLIGKLKSGDVYTAANLASNLSVSQRTLMRDLATLKEQGYPIEAEKGRGGGIRLYPRWGIGRLALNYREVLDLLLAVSVIEKLNSPLFLNNLASVKNKLFASFPDAQRPQVQQLRQRLLIGDTASAHVMTNYEEIPPSAHTDVVAKGFFELRMITIEYQRADGEASTRTIEPHYMFLNWPIWYIIGWDLAKAVPRTFRLDRIATAVIADARFQLRPLSHFPDELENFSVKL